MRRHTCLGLLAGLLILPGSGYSAPREEAAIRVAISELDQLPPDRQAQQILWITNAIAQEQDVQISGLLNQALDKKLREMAEAVGGRETFQRTLEEASAPTPEIGSATAAREQESLLLLQAQAGRPVPSEEELAGQIDELTYDPEHPEVGLNKAMEIASVIDRIGEPELQTRLRTYLQERLDTLQGVASSAPVR